MKKNIWAAALDLFVIAVLFMFGAAIIGAFVKYKKASEYAKTKPPQIEFSTSEIIPNPMFIRSGSTLIGTTDLANSPAKLQIRCPDNRRYDVNEDLKGVEAEYALKTILDAAHIENHCAGMPETMERFRRKE